MFLKMITLLTSVLLISSCSASWHLKRALQKGATVKADTVWVTKEVVIPEARIDTVFRDVNFTDTITFIKDRIVTKVKVNTVTREVYINTVCPPDTVRIKVPVAVNQKIEAGKTGWEFWLWIVSAACVGAVLSRIFWRK